MSDFILIILMMRSSTSFAKIINLISEKRGFQQIGEKGFKPYGRLIKKIKLLLNVSDL